MKAKESSLFFSYARADAEFALKLAKSLRSAGANLWIDQLDIQAGDRWDRAVEQALNKAEGMLVILSPTSVDSNNVMDEVSFALDRNKRIIPVLYQTCTIPFRLLRVQHVDFTVDFNQGLERLLNGLGLKGSSEEPQPTQPVPDEQQAPPGQKSKSAEVVPAKETVPRVPPVRTEEKVPDTKRPERTDPRKIMGIIGGFIVLALILTYVFLSSQKTVTPPALQRETPPAPAAAPATTPSPAPQSAVTQSPVPEPTPATAPVPSKVIPLSMLTGEKVLRVVGPYHLGDEEVKGWPKKHGICWEGNFNLDSTPHKLEMRLKTFGVESSSIRLNERYVDSLPVQTKKPGQLRPNYWSTERNIPLPVSFLHSGSNNLKICAEPVLDPEFPGDVDDLQIKDIQIIQTYPVK